MAKPKKIKIMVASTVYNNRDLLLQICGMLNTYGYHVINSDYGTLHPALGQNNTDACLAAVEECDIFLGIINPTYGSGITHKEFKKAIAINKPRHFLAHIHVPFARKLLEPAMYEKDKKTRTGFTLEKTSVMDIRVIDMYEDAIESSLPYIDRKYHWVQEFYRSEEAIRHVEALFADEKRVRAELAKLKPSP